LKVLFSNESLINKWTIPENAKVFVGVPEEAGVILPDYFVTTKENVLDIDTLYFKLTNIICDCVDIDCTPEFIRDFFLKGGYTVCLTDSERVLEEKKKQANLLIKSSVTDFDFCGIIGNSPPMTKLYSFIEKVAKSDATALIRGESGVGKELVAKAIHDLSNRKSKPFVVVNCAAIPETLLEDELFGHVKGAFTDARDNRKGRFEEADTGVIFLDEIGDMPVSLQVKLLRVLQEHEIQPLGSNKIRKVDVRVVSATSCNLEEKIKNGEFREDLYYRLNVIPLNVPALRDRKEDIPLLVYNFIEDIADRYNMPPVQLSVEALRRLKSYDWPGNVRELQNYIERLIVLNQGKRQIEVEDLPSVGINDNKFQDEPEIIGDLPEEGISFDSIVSKVERELILKSLEKTNGNQTKAAELLDMKRTTFIEKMKKHL
jgi:transcriptional regulator with GAF, ATPase, and Fis domain